VIFSRLISGAKASTNVPSVFIGQEKMEVTKSMKREVAPARMLQLLQGRISLIETLIGFLKKHPNIASY
jgi:hypothetical protein